MRRSVCNTVNPARFIAVIVCCSNIKGPKISGSAERTRFAIHIAIKAFVSGAYALSVMLLSLPVKVDVVVVGIEFFLGARDAFLGGTDVDITGVFIICHNLAPFGFTIRPEPTIRYKQKKTAG